MKLSVVIPARNEEKYLPKTLRSLEQLDLKPDEVIVVDGGSTDQTRTIAKKFGARVVVVKDSGIGKARQVGLDTACGDIVATTDADTVVPPDWLSKIVQALNRPNVSGVFSGYRVADGRFFYRFFINVIHPSIFLLSAIVNAPIAPGQNSAFWRTKGLEAGGYPTTFRSAEDIELMRRLS
ncbi:MAG: glycosyltransferase family 2 protein, partial [bacterium]|nr:glycosyltransferase family 2 protein [bacterium]